MASEMFSVIGTAMYPKLFENNRDMHEGFHGSYGGAYTVDVILDQDQLNVVSSSGSRVKPRIVDEGLSIKFKRKHQHPTIEALGGPPKVVDSDDVPWDDTVFIGNGSKVEVFFEVYDTKMGKGTRLEGVRVLEHVPYETDGEQESSPKSKLPF